MWEAFASEMEKIALSSGLLQRAATKARQLGARAAATVKSPRVGNIERNIAADDWIKRLKQSKKFQSAAVAGRRMAAAKAPLPLP